MDQYIKQEIILQITNHRYHIPAPNRKFSKAGCMVGSKVSANKTRICCRSLKILPKVNINSKEKTYLEGSGLLRLSNGLDKSSRGKGFDTAIPQTSSRATVPEQLKRVVRNVVVQAQNGCHVDDLHIRPQVINHDSGRGGRGRGRGRRRRGGGFEGALELGEVAGEGEAGAEEERAGLEGPRGEGGDEAGGFEGVVVVGLVVEGWEVGGDQAQRVVLSSEVEHVVGLRLPLLHHAPTRIALRYRPPGVRRRATTLARRAVRTPHLFYFLFCTPLPRTKEKKNTKPYKEELLYIITIFPHF